MIYYTIYQVTHRESGKYYIGKHQTKDLNDGYMGSGHRIRAAVKKYGVEAFDKKVLHVFKTEKEMNAKEAELVTEEFCSREDTYNLCVGGQGGWSYILENRFALDRIDELRKNPDFIAKQSAKITAGLKNRYRFQPKTGSPHSEETKKLISSLKKETGLGANNSQFGSMWITDGVKNRKINKTEVLPEGWAKGRVSVVQRTE